MSNIADVDFQEIEALFSVIEKCVMHSGKHTGIMAAAATRLQDIDEELRESQAEAKAEADAEAAREAAANRPRAIPAGEDTDGDGIADEDEDTVEDVPPTPPARTVAPATSVRRP